MDFRTEKWELVEKENLGTQESGKDVKSAGIVSILKSSQKFNCLPLEKRQTKVSFKNSPTCHKYNLVPCKTESSFDWEELRKLDDESSWTERTQVVTKDDHRIYAEAAKEFLDTIVSDLPCLRGNQMEENMNSSPELPEINSAGHVGISPNVYDDGSVPEVPDEDLEAEIHSEFSKLQVTNRNCSQTFSPIGSARTSPEQENMIGSNEDLDKLLTPHDDLPENEEGELYTGNNTADNLLREITDEKHSYKSAGLFVVNPSDLENEFQDNNISSESPFSGVTQEVEDTFEKLAEGQREENDQFRDEDFRPASEAMWELDYLEKCGNNSKGFEMSALARQSLYVKFDPLVKGSGSQSPVENDVGLRDVLPQKPLSMGDNLLLMDSPQPPMKSSVVPRLPRARNQATQGKTVSPCAVDKLLSFSPSLNEGMKTEQESAEEKCEEASVVQRQLSEAESDEAVTVKKEQVSREKALFFSKEDFDEAVKRETEYFRRQMQEECAIGEMKISDLSKRNEELNRETEELRVVMQEYEKTIAEMIESNQKSQDHFSHSASEVAKERDQLQADLTAVETAFSDLHRRYEKLKGVVENFKKNEDILKKATSDYQEKLKKSEEKYRLLKKHAEEKIESANIEISRVRKGNESEIAVMKAALKKEQAKTASLEMSLQQKISENAELTAICDELISKMGGQR